MTTSLLGLGTATPVHLMNQEEALQMTARLVATEDRQRRLLNVLFHKSGVRNRHTCVPHAMAYQLAGWVGADPASGEILGGAAQPLPGGNGHSSAGPSTRERMALYAEHAAPLAKQAIHGALADAGLDPAAVTHLVTVSCTGFDAPGVDIEIIDGLGLRPTTQRVNVGYMGCHGAINGMRVARAITASEPDACVLLSATELCSLHYQFVWHDDCIVGNALFADGSGAALFAARPAAEAGRLRLRATGSCLLPDSRDAMSWEVGDHGFAMRLTQVVAERIGAYLRPWLSAWLGQFGHAVESVGSWAVHPGGPRILQAVEKSLGLSRERTRHSHEILASHGNMSSPTVLFILDRLRREQCPLPCVALGFGPGLVAEAALFE